MVLPSGRAAVVVNCILISVRSSLAMLLLNVYSATGEVSGAAAMVIVWASEGESAEVEVERI